MGVKYDCPCSLRELPCGRKRSAYRALRCVGTARSPVPRFARLRSFDSRTDAGLLSIVATTKLLHAPDAARFAGLSLLAHNSTEGSNDTLCRLSPSDPEVMDVPEYVLSVPQCRKPILAD